MTQRTRLTPEDKKYILKRHKEGAALRAIGREVGRPDITVRRTLEAAGIDLGPPKRTNKRSSPETEALVLSLYDEGRTWDEITEQAQITSNTVAKILQRHGREFDRKGEAAAPRAEIITALSDVGHSARAIGRLLGHSKSTIRNIITSSDMPPPRRGGCENPDYFEAIDTPEKAYWLGFLSADGCIVTSERHPEGDHLTIALGICDAGHLEKLKQAIGAYPNVRTGVRRDERGTNGWAALATGSRRLAIALMALGVTPRKSTGNLEPWDGPADLMPHYWRGMVDGNGSLPKKTETDRQVFLCGSEACVRAFKAWVNTFCDTDAEPFFERGCWRLFIGGRYQVPKIVRALYIGAPVSLDRKQKIADWILANEQPYKKPGPSSKFASEEEKREARRASGRERQRRYLEKKRQAAARTDVA